MSDSILEGQLLLLDRGDAATPRSAEYPSWYTPSNERKTANKKVLLGLHPMGMKLSGDGGRCGWCKNLCRQESRVRTFLKCELVPATGGPATDIRAKWAACEKWVPDVARALAKCECPHCSSSNLELCDEQVGCIDCGGMYEAKALIGSWLTKDWWA